MKVLPANLQFNAFEKSNASCRQPTIQYCVLLYIVLLRLAIAIKN